MNALTTPDVFVYNACGDSYGYLQDNKTIEREDLRCKTQNQLNERERFRIRVLNCKVPNGYNQSDGGEGGHKKVKLIQRRKNLMLMDLNGRSLVEQVKFVATFRQCSIKDLGEKFNRRQGTNYSAPSFSRKLNKGNFNFDELQGLGEILGFKVKLELVDQTNNGG